jgi:hypothetical protein
MGAAAWIDDKKTTVGNFRYALGYRKYSAEIVKQVLAGGPRAAGLQVPSV